MRRAIPMRERAEEDRDRLIGLLRTSSQMVAHLLLQHDPDASGRGIVELLGRAVGASRCYWLECQAEADGRVVARQRAEWCAEGVSSRLDTAGLPAAQRDQTPFLPEQLWRGEPFKAHVQELPDHVRRDLDARCTKSMLLMPLATRGQLAGLLGFEQCGHERDWRDDEIHLLSAGASTFSLAIERWENDRQRCELAAVVDQLGEGVVIADLGGRIRYANAAYESMTGFACEGLVGRDYLSLAAENEPADQLRQLGETVERGDVWRGIIRIRRRDGGEYQDCVSAFPLRDGAGRMVGYGSTHADITERLYLQERLRLAQRMETIGQLAGSIAHDFNNLITVILGGGELLRGRFSPDDPGREEASAIIRTAERARELIRGLLGFARRQHMCPSDLDLNSMILEMQPMLRRLIRESIDVRLVLGAHTPTAHADRGQLEQTVLNLCVNANDAIPDTGTITVSTENVEIDEEFLATRPWGQPGSYVRFSVRDTGIGMDAETQKNAFQPFFTTKTSGKGTGLGLATVYRIVKQHQGMVDVTSAPGQGATFDVYLPVIEARIPEMSGARLEEIRGGDEAILVVEDQNELRRMMQRALSVLGYRVISARNGAEALEMLGTASDSIDLVITDIVMPQMGGRELHARASALSLRTVFLYTSGYEHEMDREDLVREEAEGFLTKPFRLEELARKVREVLDSVRRQSPWHSKTRDRAC